MEIRTLTKIGKVFIDGENFRHLLNQAAPNIDLMNFDYQILFKRLLPNNSYSEINYYMAKIKLHSQSVQKSRQLIKRQRSLKTNLEKQGFTVILGGTVRGQTIEINGEKRIVFREKGIDVRVAVDLVSDACDGKISTAFICSSDSDLQPAVAEIKSRGVYTVYIGFEGRLNSGLSYTTHRTLIIGKNAVQTGNQK